MAKTNMNRRQCDSNRNIDPIYSNKRLLEYLNNIPYVAGLIIDPGSLTTLE